MRDGLVVVDKAGGWTSHDVVAKLRGVYGQRRVGHAGTLDPDATGVLLVGLGRVTRLLRYLQESTKTYRARVVFGVATDTFDGAGTVLERIPMPVTREQVDTATRAFVGDIEQVPPMVSAIKVGGRKLYELAREGIEIEREPRHVRIDAIEIEDFVAGANPEATLRVDCSSGTYIRSLAADLGSNLGGCAHLAELRRLRAGGFTVDDARTLDDMMRDPDAALLSPAAAMRDLEPVTVDAETARAVGHGSRFPLAVLATTTTGPYAVVDDAGALLAVYERKADNVKPVVVLAAQEAAS
jgi:tRNA pseudouridine55 synthase